MLFLVLLNVWCSHPGFLKMVPHSAPAGPTNSWHVCQSFISTFLLVDLCTRCSQTTHGWREVSESSCSLGKARTNSEITFIWRWGRSSQSWAFPARWGAVASRAVQHAGEGTHGPQQPHNLQDRVQRGAREEGKGWWDGNCWEPGLKLELLCNPIAVLQKSRLNRLC